jgi:large subunit ribosomal protein L14e
MFSIGRVCYKTAGRDSNRVCVVVESVDDRYVVVDGDTRRKKVNVQHLEPTAKVVKVSEKASTEDVRKSLEAEGYKLHVVGKSRKTPARVKKSKVSRKAAEEKPVEKKATKKASSEKSEEKQE